MKGKHLYCFVCAYLCLISLHLNALDPIKTFDQYQLVEWGVENGLPSDIVGAIVQTPGDSYLWIRTINGLVRFDGVKFETFNTQTTPGIKDNNISALYLDREGVLWIGTGKGLLNYKDGYFKEVPGSKNIKDYFITCILEDINGTYWIGTENHYLTQLEKGNLTIYNTEDGLEGKQITAIFEDSKGHLWVGTGDKGLYKWNYGKFAAFNVDGLKDPYPVYSICEDQEGTLWIAAFNQGVIEINDNITRIYSTKDGISSSKVFGVFEDSRRNLWVGTANGLNRLKRNRAGQIKIEKILENKIILSFFEDREKNLWLGTKFYGLLRLRDVPFTTFSTEKGVPDLIISLFQDEEDVIWIGSAYKGLYTYTAKEGICHPFFIADNSIRKVLNDRLLWAIRTDLQGNLWLGTDGSGLVVKQGETFTRFTTENGLVSNSINSLFWDSSQNLWIATANGLNLYKNGNFTTLAVWENSGHYLYNFFEDKNHTIWMGTPNGITGFASQKGEFKPIKNILPGVKAAVIYQDDAALSADSEEILWIGTLGSGLKRFTLKKGSEEPKGTFTTITRNDGLGSDYIFQILQDEQGYFWMSSDEGVLRVWKEELNAFANGQVKKIKCQTYGSEDGLKSTDCNRAAVKTKNHEFWFATRKGIAVVNPGEIKKSSPFPLQVIIEKIMVDGKTIEVFHKQRSNVFPDMENIAFFFTAPCFTAPGKIQFKYKLEGYDKNWLSLQPSQERIAKYTHLSPGEYRFRITAVDDNGRWNITGDTMAFSLKTSFYKTTGFKIILLAVLLALGTGGYFLIKKIVPSKEKVKSLNKGLTLDPHQTDVYLNRLVELLETENLYRTENLLIQSVSERLSIPSYLLSKIINEKLNMNFSELINSYRIKEAQKRLANPGERETTILDIAYEVGFNTKTAFNKEFKKYTGTTPSEFRKKQVLKR